MKSFNLLKIILAVLILFSFCSSTYAWREGFGKRGKEYDVQPPPPSQVGPSEEEIDQARRQEAERQRQQLEGEEAEKARQREEAFQHKKQDALNMMKGVQEGELGLKGVEPSECGELGLKGGDEPKAVAPRRKAAAAPKTREPVDSSVVDLRHLDPNRPITVDPNVVKGRPRAIPVQVSLETLNNATYQKGCEALQQRDPTAAVRYLQQAQKERPGDLLVRANLLLAQDLVRVHQQETQKTLGAYMAALDGVGAVQKGDYSGALSHFQRAHELNPQEKRIARWKQALEGLNLDQKMLEIAPGLSPQDKAMEMKAMNLAGNGMVALLRGDYQTAALALQAVQKTVPQSQFIKVLLDSVRREQKAGKTPGAKKISRRN